MTIATATGWPCRQCGTHVEIMYGRPGHDVCSHCYDDSTAWPDMGTKSRPRGWYATHIRSANGEETEIPPVTADNDPRSRRTA